MLISVFSFVLISAWLQSSVAQKYPATVEIDLVFPRNDTFAPSLVMPLVFAVQNPIATVALPYHVEWIIRRFRNGSLLFVDSFEPKWANYTTESNPYYFYIWVEFVNATEGVYTLSWTVVGGNCSEALVDNTLGETSKSNFLLFTLKNGAQMQSLVPSPGTCPIAGNTFNVTGTLPVSDAIEFDFHTTCAVLDPGPRPPANPCAVQVKESVASSILAVITASACVMPWGTGRPVLTSGCPSPSSASSWAIRSHGGERWTLGVAMISLLSLVVFRLVFR